MNGENVNQNQENNIQRDEKTNVVPNIDISMPVNRRRQSIEGSIIMTENNNVLSANLSISANGPNSTTDNEYDSGRIRNKSC